MQTYKQFLLSEVGFADMPGKGNTSWTFTEPNLGRDVKEVASKTRRAGMDKIIASGSLVGGYWVLTTAPKTNTKEWRLYAVDNSGVIEIEAILNTYKQHSYNVETLVALQGNTIKADDLYGAFVRSGRILVGTSQSFGGRAVWSKLSAQKGVVVFGWDSKTQTPINLGPRYKMDNPEIHVDPSDYDVMASMREKGAGDTAINPYYQEYKHLAAAHIVASPRDSKIKIHPPGK